METLIVYCKVQVGNPPKKGLKVESAKKEEEADEDKEAQLNLADFSMDNLEINGTRQAHRLGKVGVCISGSALSRRDVRMNNETRRCATFDLSRL